MLLRSLPPRRPAKAARSAADRRLRARFAARRAPSIVLFLRFALPALLLTVSLMFFDWQIRPIIKVMSQHQAKIICTQSINEAVNQTLQEDSVSYSSLVSLSRDSQGVVSSVETNITEINRLKANIALSVLQSLRSHGVQDLSIPLGSLLDSQLFSGRGPLVPFKVVPSSSATVDINGKFTSAGINQTIHQILLTVQVDADVVLPRLTAPVSTSTTFVIAETVIVGRVPDAFTEVTGDNRPLPGQIFDYGAKIPAATP